MPLTPNPEDPDPAPWPWRQLTGKAWRRVFASSHVNSLTWAALNPQPLPPRIQFSIALAQEVMERANLVQEMADGMSNLGEERGIIIVSGYINRFVDDICLIPAKIKLPKWWGPWPPDPDPRWTGLELAVIGTLFQKEARLTDHQGLQRTLHEGGERLVQAGVSRM